MAMKAPLARSSVAELRFLYGLWALRAQKGAIPRKTEGPFLMLRHVPALPLGILVLNLDLGQRRESPNSLRWEEGSRPLSPKPQAGSP